MNRYEIALGKLPPKICVNDLESGPMESYIDLDLDPGSVHIEPEDNVVIKIKHWDSRPVGWNTIGAMDYLNGITIGAIEYSGISKKEFKEFRIKSIEAGAGFWVIKENEVEKIITTFATRGDKK